MSSKDSLRTCCVIKCVNINTPLNSEVSFFKFPATRYRSIQRKKWVQAVKSNNGPWWLPNADSLICSDHFANGKPSDCPLNVDYAPSVFFNMKKGEIKSRTVTVKEFALQYIEHDALLEQPTKSNIYTDERKLAYVKLAAALYIPVSTVRSWEKRFREYYEQKMAELAEKQDNNEDIKPNWLRRVAKRLGVPPAPSLPALGGTGAVVTGAALTPSGAVSPGGVVAALCSAARARGTLCSTALYNDVRRSLRLSAAINDLHAVWVSVQRVSLEQVVVAARAGDTGPAPPMAAIADLVLLHTDVDMHRLITDESVMLYEESTALHTLWQLVQRHQLEDAALMDSCARSQRWTRAHRDYLDSGRSASLVVLQRRWHELKLQARVRLAAHWRRRDPPPPAAPAPAAPAPAAPAPAAPAPAAPAPAAPPPLAPHDVYPRPAPIHISILKRYPHVATGAFRSWRQLVVDGAVVTEPLEKDKNTEQTEGKGNKKPETAEPLQPDINVIEPKTEKPAVDETDIEKTAGSEPAVKQNSVDEPLADVTADNDQKVEDSPVGEIKCKPLVRQTTTGDPLVENVTAVLPTVDEPMDTDMLNEQSASNDSLTVKPTVNQLKVEQNMITDPATDPEAAQLTVKDFQAVHAALDTPMEICDVLDEMDATDDLQTVKQVVNNLKVEQNTVNDSSADDPATEQPTANDLLVVPPEIFNRMYNNLMDKQGTGDNQLLLKEPKIEQTTNRNHLADNPVTEATMNSILLEEQGTTDDRLLLKEPKVEQAMNVTPLADKTVTEELTNFALLDKQVTTDDRLLLKEPKVEQATDKNPLAENPVIDETTNSVLLDEQPTVSNTEVVQTTENDLSVEQSKVDNPLPKKNQNSVLLALLTADNNDSEIKSLINFSKTKRFMDSLKNQRIMNGPPVRSPGEHAVGVISPDVLAGPDLHERLEPSSELVLHDEDKSNEVIRPYYQANSSHTDTDSEDNLVIDEYSNNTPCLLGPEPIANTEIHGVDTALPHTTLENVAPTIQVLQMIDPSTVKKEILFESDEEDSQLCVEEDKVDIGIKKKVSAMANKIVFANEEPGLNDVKTEDDVTERIDSDDSQDGDLVDDTAAIDHKLLMDTKVLLFRIDKTRAWKNNVRKDKSIKVSRIHRRFYTPSTKKYYYTPMSNNKTKTILNITKKYSRLKSVNRKSQPESRNNTSNSNDHANTQDIKVDDACVEQVANTHSVRQLCRNIKREMIDDTLEDKTPKKRVKTESDSDDNPLLTVRKMRETEIQGREEQTETENASVENELVEVSSSDDELMNNELLLNLGWEDKRKKVAKTRAASSIEWSSQFAPVLGGRVSKRVTLPDRAQLRRDARGPRVAQVAPISTSANTTEASGKDSAPADTLGDPADDDTPLAWRALDLPSDEQLEAALDELTSACSVEQVLERSHCCAARRHREVNDTRRRIGVPDLPLHTHADGVCTCCCAHLSDSDARSRLDVQLRALHSDIERMLWKTAGGTKPRLAPKPPSPSPTPTITFKPSTKDTPLNSSTEATSSKSKPIPTEAKVAKPTTYTNRSKKRRSKRALTSPAKDPAPIVDYYEEWQRQKTMNAQYFQIKGLNSSKKNKSKAPENVAQSSTPRTVTQSGAPQTVVQRTTPPTVVQSTIPQNAQITTPQNMVQSSPSTVAHSMTPLQNTSTGLMPYIRESRLIAPAGPAPVTHTIEVPTLVPVMFPRGAPPRALAQLPRPNPRTIAPKPESMRRASEAQHKRVKPVEEEPQTKTQLTNPFTYKTNQPRRMNLTTQQVAEPEPSTSEPAVKPVSILEEYSRTLGTAPKNMPVINALSLRVPNGPEGPKTTIVMALNLASDNVIKQTINTLYANETVDLTKEPETSSDVTKPPEVRKTVAPVCDIVGVVKGLINAGNKTLKPSSSTASRSLLKVNPEKQSEAPTPRTKTPKIISLTKSLRVGDVIEIDDTDSNSDDSSNGSLSSKSNSSIPINKSSDPSLDCNEKSVCSNDPVVNDNNSSKLANSSNTNTVSQSTDVSSSKVTNSIETKSGNSNNLLQTAEGRMDKISNQTVTNINESVDQKESSNSKYMMGTISTTDVPVSSQLVKISDLISNIEDSYQPNFNIHKLTSKAPWNTRKNIEANSKPTSSIQTVPTKIRDKPVLTFCKIAPSSNTNKNTKSVSETTTSNPSVSNTYGYVDLNTPSASEQYVYKFTNFNQSVSKATAPNQSVSKATTSNRSVSKTKTSKQSVSKTKTSKQSVSKTKNSKQSVSKTQTSNQSVSKTQTSNQPVSKTQTSNQSVSKTQTSNQSVSKTQTSNQPVSKTQTSNQSGSKTQTSNQPVSKTQTSNQSVSKTQTSNQSVSKTQTSNQPVSKTTASKQSTSNINTTKELSEDTSDNSAVGKVVPAVKKPSRSKTPQTRYRWHSMVEELTDCSEDPAYSGIQTLKTLLDDSQRCPARFADVRSMPDFIAKLSTSVDTEGYCHKKSAPEVSAGALPCGATLLCVDAACPPLVLKTQNEPLYKSMPHLRAHLVLTDADLPCKQPTYWTLASYRLMSRVVPDNPDVPDGPDAPAMPVDASKGEGAQCCPEKGEGVKRKEDRKICEKNHGFKVWTAFCTADGVRQAARAGATLFLLNVLRARVLVLAIERVREPGGGRYRHRAIADVEPEILRNLEALVDEAEIEEEQSGRANVIG